jgi:hypothetical protein
VSLYVAERYAPAGDVYAALHGDRRAAASSPGIRHVRTWLLPADETCLSLFDAPSADLLRAAGDAAGLRYSRITEALEGCTP